MTPDRSIRIEHTAGAVHATIGVHPRWTFVWQIAFPICVLILAWHLGERRPPLPYIGRVLPGAASAVATLALAILIGGAALAILMALLDQALERGTIHADRNHIRISLRGVHRSRIIDLPAPDTREVRAVPDGVKYGDRFANTWQTPLLLRIVCNDRPPIELLTYRRPDSLTALATAITAALGVSHRHRRNNWMQRQSQLIQNNDLNTLAYGTQTEGVTLSVRSEEIELKLPPRGVKSSAAQFLITNRTLTVAISDSPPLTIDCSAIHWIVPLDQAMGFGPLAIVREDGVVITLFHLRPIPELAYVASILNAALGLAAGFDRQ